MQVSLAVKKDLERMAEDLQTTAEAKQDPSAVAKELREMAEKLLRIAREVASTPSE